MQRKSFPRLNGASGFRQNSDEADSAGNFQHDGMWRGKYFANKQLEVYAIPEGDDWIILTVIARYY